MGAFCFVNGQTIGTSCNDHLVSQTAASQSERSARLCKVGRAAGDGRSCASGRAGQGQQERGPIKPPRARAEPKGSQSASPVDAPKGSASEGPGGVCHLRLHRPAKGRSPAPRPPSWRRPAPLSGKSPLSTTHPPDQNRGASQP